ncbi:MAG: hypothetical protein ACHRXM_24550 [Isosphaerales bacterium]
MNVKRVGLAMATAMLLCGACPAVNAGTVTYNVDMTGFSESFGGPPVPSLSVVGTITYDTSLQLITTSALSIKDPTVLAVLPPTLTTQTLTSAYLQATPTALYAVPTVGSGTLNDLWGTVSPTTYGFQIFDISSGPVFIEITGPNPPITGFHPGGYGEDGIFGSPTEVLIGTAAATPEPSSLALAIIGATVVLGYGRYRGRKPGRMAELG